MSGRVGDLSAKQAALLSQFKENVEDVLQTNHSDKYLLRWLRARNFDLKKSEKMLRDSLAWRERSGADTILEDWQPPEVLTNYYPGGLFGHDREGSPIWMEVAGRSDIKGLLHSVKKSDIIKLKIQACEKIHKKFQENTEQLGKEVDGLVIILDLEHYGLKHLWRPGIEVLSEVLAMFEAHYPETLKCTYVVNAPRIFPFVFNLVKPFLSEDTKKKVFVYGGQWREKLLKHIDPDQLPKHWGGTATDPDGDPYCRSKICMGGEVPKEYYIHKEDLSNSLTSVHVGRASTQTIRVKVTESGSVIRWQFWTEEHDISFSVYREKAGEKAAQDTIVPAQRVNSHMVPEDGSVIVHTPGTYALKFDNNYSWMRSKEVHYCLEVLPQGDCQDQGQGQGQGQGHNESSS